VRGLLHGSGAALWLVFAASLAAGPRFPERFALLLCAASQAALFATSALYHSLPWRPRWKTRMQRADHAMIHVKIAGTVTALTWLTLPAPWAGAVVAAVWAVAAAGIAHKASVPEIPEHPSIRVQLGQAPLGVPAIVVFGVREPGLATESSSTSVPPSMVTEPAPVAPITSRFVQNAWGIPATWPVSTRAARAAAATRARRRGAVERARRMGHSSGA
jgi:hypothetical protein